MSNKTIHHINLRNKVEEYLKKDLSVSKIANEMHIPLGTRYIRGSVKWYVFCIKAKENQKKAVEKHPSLYSDAGKIAQQKHPWIGKNLGKKYGPIQGKINAEKLKGNSKYFSEIAKKLHQVNPEHSKTNMIKAHETMKKTGIFNEHQRKAALKCKEKNPSQLKEMSKKAHAKYPLALLALESRRKNYPYDFMGRLFDSNEEKIICKRLVEVGLIEKPIEEVNTHFRIGKCHIDFFIQNKLFIEFHPPRKFGRIVETSNSYYKERRKLLDENGFKNYPLIIITSIKEVNEKLEEINNIIHSL